MTRKFRDTKYCADKTGRIFNSRTGKELRQQSNGRYNKVTLTIDGKQRQFLVHRIIAELFIPNPENKGEVNHINGIKTDNRVENLEWVTPQENQQHSVRIGLKPLGTELWNGKFTREQVMIWFNGEYGEPVEPTYKMVCWLLEQGFIKKGGEQ